MFQEDELLPLSGLQHVEFCERQWALIHIEQAWAENRLTAEGRVLHERVHEAGDESRVDVLICRGVPLRSLGLGLSGQADVVEFHRAPEDDTAVALPGRRGRWHAFPVEYKRGRPKAGACDEVQLCAQAMCLEEMLGTKIARGALFYGQVRRRTDVEFAPDLRTRTEALSRRMHEIYRSGVTPRAMYSKRCENCSLREVCLPQAVENPRGIAAYLRKALAGER